VAGIGVFDLEFPFSSVGETLNLVAGELEVDCSPLFPVLSEIRISIREV